MKRSTRILLVLLALLMLCPLFAACAENPENNGDDGTSDIGDTTPGGSVTTDSNLDINGYKKDDLPDDLDFGQRKVNVLHWNTEKPEFFVEGMNGGSDDAIFTRNAQIENRLGVELVFTEEKGNADNQTAFIQKVEATRGEWDIIASYSRVAGSLSIRGLYADLNEVEDSYLNFDQPWWPTILVDTVTIGDALYFVSGDISTNVLHFMYTIYFNKDLKATYTDITEDFYELVAEGKWTINKLIGFASGRYQDDNSNGKGANHSNSDLEDTYGFCTIFYGVDAFYTGSGLKLVVQDDEKLLKISDDYTSDKAIDLVDRLGEFLAGPDCVTFMGSGQYRQPFVNGKALFCQERAYLASNYLTDDPFTYGILPTPKYDLKQEDYITIVGNPFTLYGIAIDCKDPLIMTAVIECWGSEGYRNTTPALFEETMKAKYSDKPEDAAMWDIIRTTACFDLGRLISKTEIGYYLSEEISKYACRGDSWASPGSTIASTASKTLEGIVEKYKAIQN